MSAYCWEHFSSVAGVHLGRGAGRNEQAVCPAAGWLAGPSSGLRWPSEESEQPALPSGLFWMGGPEILVLEHSEYT